jgi:hypothetical protein
MSKFMLIFLVSSCHKPRPFPEERGRKRELNGRVDPIINSYV